MSNNNSLGIQGMEDMDASFIPLPYAKLVQPGTVDALLTDGREASAGSYYFSDTKESFGTLSFILLKSKHGEKTFTDKDGRTVTKRVLGILGQFPDSDRKFILTLSLMSFSGLGRLIAMMKAKGVTKTWEYVVEATSHLVKNDKGKFYVADFQLAARIPEELQEGYELTSLQLGSVIEAKAFDPVAEAQALPENTAKMEDQMLGDELENKSIEPPAPTQEQQNALVPDVSDDIPF